MNSYFETAGIKLTNKQKKQFEEYCELILSWNKRINITTIVEKEEIYIKHFIDSICINKIESIKVKLESKCRLIDVGTGGGFPGIPLKIIYPEIELTLLDSLNKRIEFLEDVIKKLMLENVKTIHGRAEEEANKIENREIYDFATTRAVSKLSVLTEYTLPFLKIGGESICFKSDNIDEEIDDAKHAIEILGGKENINEKFKIPGTNINRRIYTIEKVKLTPKKYPRRAGVPAKKPIM